MEEKKIPKPLILSPTRSFPTLQLPNKQELNCPSHRNTYHKYLFHVHHRKIRLIEGNAKCRHLQKFTCKETCGRCLSVGCPEPQTLSYTLFTCIQYIYSHREGRGRRVVPERRLEGQQFTKLSQNTNMADCISSL
jgi:hypothetical protein